MNRLFICFTLKNITIFEVISSYFYCGDFSTPSPSHVPQQYFSDYSTISQSMTFWKMMVNGIQIYGVDQSHR